MKLNSQDVEMRNAALSELAEAEDWDESAVPALAACASDDPSCCVRLRACDVLAQEAMRGSRPAAVAIASRLQDHERLVREAALDTLSCLAACGPTHSVKAAAETLTRVDKGLRWRSRELSTARATLRL